MPTRPFDSATFFTSQSIVSQASVVSSVFVGFSADQQRLSRMLESMAGLVTGTRDALTRFTQPLTGSYYFVPSVESLRRLR